jgi:tetratricopeptide (TPR) repeat protein
VIDIRRRIREQVMKDQPVQERLEREEKDASGNDHVRSHDAPACKALELDEMYAHYRAGALKDVELLALESIARQGLTADLANVLSLVYWSQNRKTLEMQYAREAVRLDPQHPVFLANLGYSLADAGDLKEAASTLRRAVGMDESLAFAYEKLGDICRAQADEPAARREYAQAIRLYEARAAQNDLEALSTLGRIYHKIGQYEKCEEARANHNEAWLNAQYQGDHRHRIAVSEPHEVELES